MILTKGSRRLLLGKQFWVMSYDVTGDMEQQGNVFEWQQ